MIRHSLLRTTYFPSPSLLSSSSTYVPLAFSRPLIQPQAKILQPLLTMSSFTPVNMAEQNHIGSRSSDVDPLNIPSGDENHPALSTGSTGSPSEVESQSDSLADEPYHELLQLLQQGAPPPVKWTCVRCGATLTSSCALLNHHVASCPYRNISPNAVFSTRTVVAMLLQVDPEHPVDGEPIWWVDSGDDGEEATEEQPSDEEEQNEEVHEMFPGAAPTWLSDQKTAEWDTRRARELIYSIHLPTS